MCVQERRTNALRWADINATRLERVLNDQWYDLVKRVEVGITNMTLRELTLGPSDDFGSKVIEPAVKCWVERHHMPVITEALDEFRRTIRLEPSWSHNGSQTAVRTEGELYTTDVLAALAVPAGIAVAAGGISAGIVTTTTWLIFTTVAVSWPVLIGGFFIGSVLWLIGVVSLKDIRSKLRQRMTEALEPQLKDALIGNGVKQKNGKRTPSLLCQLQQQFREVAASAREQLQQEDCPQVQGEHSP